MFEPILDGIVSVKRVFSYVRFQFIQLLDFSQGGLRLFRMIIQCFLEVTAGVCPTRCMGDVLAEALNQPH